MVREINSSTKLLCLLGSPVEHSLSPIMHNYLFNKLDLNYLYLAFDVKPDDLHKSVEGLKAIGVKGFNVTIPHKENIIYILDEIDYSAKMVGAVNTVVLKNGKLYGYNTDITGFKKSLNASGCKVSGKKVAVLGAGGAAKAVVRALFEENVDEVYIINRHHQKAEQIAAAYRNNQISNIKSVHNTNIKDIIKDCTLVVNTTSVGMNGYLPDKTPIPSKYLNDTVWVYDLVYNPLETVLLREAKKMGCKIISGLDMLVHQGADAFKIWTGIEPPRETVKELLLKNHIL